MMITTMIMIMASHHLHAHIHTNATVCALPHQAGAALRLRLIIAMVQCVGAVKRTQDTADKRCDLCEWCTCTWMCGCICIYD